MGSRDESVPGSVVSLRPANVAVLRPAEQMFDDMLAGWAGQQSSRLLSPVTIRAREGAVRRFAEFCATLPWEWTATDVEEWTAQLLSGPRPKAPSSIRGYQNAVALFCSYLTDSRYGWAEACLEAFGTHPVQVCHEWNTAIHVSDHEARPSVRPLTRMEVQALFDHADDRVDFARTSKRKGWTALFRDATLFKVIYAYGLRRREVAMLDLHDFTRNAAVPEFGAFGVCNVRWGKATRGSQPRRRAVVTVFDWTGPVLAEYVDDVLPRFKVADDAMLWPTERQSRVSGSYIGSRFAEYRDALGLDPVLHPHCLRHSYVTHLIEDGFDPLFVQQQVGHRWGSTTALYTGVSGDYRNSVLRRALDQAFTAPASASADGSEGQQG
ncbi:tyrosine-type recombinase/integrase [Jiangella alkaliphila]|uniref:tyrosine-type recombinase/integrase n=1 Tax=Jiangella alkaliphila TaxID=419479 RepID=UPI00128D0C55|nr:site-specific integrase [Jiangella alkaliphila]